MKLHKSVMSKLLLKALCALIAPVSILLPVSIVFTIFKDAKYTAYGQVREL